MPVFDLTIGKKSLRNSTIARNNTKLTKSIGPEIARSVKAYGAPFESDPSEFTAEEATIIIPSTKVCLSKKQLPNPMSSVDPR